METVIGSQPKNQWYSWIQDKSRRSFIKPGNTSLVPPVVLWMVDNEGRFVLSEGDGLSILSLEPGEVIGKPVFDVYAEVPQIQDNVRRALEGETVEEIVEFGGMMWESRYYPVLDLEGEISGVVGTAFEITDWQKQKWRQGIVFDIAASLRTVDSRAEMPVVILDRIRELLEVDSAAIVIRSSSGAEFFVELAQGNWETLSGHTLSSIIHHRMKNNTEWIANSRRYFMENGLSLELSTVDTQAMAGVPLIAQEDLIGVLWIGRRTSITEDEIQLLLAIGDMAANAFQRAAQHERTERRLQRLSALHAIDRAITSSFDLGIILDVLLNQVIVQLEVDAADVFLMDSHIQVLKFADGRGFRHLEAADVNLRMGRGLAGRVARERLPVNIPDLSQLTQPLVRTSLIEDENFVFYCGLPLISKGKIKGVLEVFHRRPFVLEREWLDFYETLGTQAAIALDNTELIDNIRQTNIRLNLAYHATLEGWVQALDLRDKETERHTQRVVKRTIQLARAMKIEEEKLVHVQRGALLHDIGKLGIPDYILNKPGSLSAEEKEEMKKHPLYAKEMLSRIEFLYPALAIPYCHHEKWDGTGYPRGLKGEQIPLEARIFSVIDVWDALGSDRPYRKAWPQAKIYEYIQNQSGIYFDPRVVQAWLTEFRIQ